MRTPTFLLLSALLFLATALRAQEMTRDDFQKTWKQGVELEDEKVMDRAVKRGSRHVIQFYEGLAFQARNGDDVEAELQCEQLAASSKRCFGNVTTLEKVGRWTEGATPELYTKLQQLRTTSGKLWNDYTSSVATGTIKTTVCSSPQVRRWIGEPSTNRRKKSTKRHTVSSTAVMYASMSDSSNQYGM